MPDSHRPAQALPLAAILEGVTAILFDMDGVLLDTEELYTLATRQVLGPLGDKFDWRIKERMMGRAPLVAAKILIDALQVPMAPEEYLERKRPVLLELFRQSQPKPGARELVEKLAARGLPLAVATSSDRVFFEAKTKHHAWFSEFAAIVCGSDPEVKAHKPAPDIFLAAAARLGAPPQSCLVFEDAAAGVESAKRAGVRRIVALADVNIDRRLLAEADYIIDSYAELTDS